LGAGLVSLTKGANDAHIAGIVAVFFIEVDIDNTRQCEFLIRNAISRKNSFFARQ
jgi:hypothetical protein